jgi:predicted ATPase
MSTKFTNKAAELNKLRAIAAEQQAYLTKRQNELRTFGATDEQLNKAFKIHRAAHNMFGDNIQINYLDFRGLPLFFETTQQEPEAFDVWAEAVHQTANHSEPFLRIRYSDKSLRLNAKLPKYWQPKYSSSTPYFTALWLFFLNKDTAKFEPNFEHIYITEGEFKAFALCSLGIPTIGISGINNGTIAYNAANQTRRELRANAESHAKFTTERAEFLPLIAEFIAEYKVNQITLNHDADVFCSAKNSQSQTRALTFKTAILDTAKACEGLEIEFSYIVGKNQALKGVDDLMLHYANKAELKTIIADFKALNPKSQHFAIYKKNRLNRLIERLYESSEMSANLTIEHNGYLTEIANERFEYEINHRKRLLLKAPTGSGKTTIARQLAKKWHNQNGYPTIIAAPLNAIIEQQANNKDAKFGYCTAADKLPELLAFKDMQKIGMFVNYDNVAFVAAKFLELYGGYNLIVDECHELTTAYSYKPEVVRAVQQAAEQAAKAMYTSATPSLLNMSDFHFIEIKSSIVAPQPKAVYYKKRLISTLCKAIATIKPQSNVQQIVLINNKKHIRKTAKALKAIGYNVKTVYTNNLDATAYNELIKTEILSSDVDVLLCSEKIATGLNIKPNGKQVRLIYTESNRNEAGFLAGFNKRLYTQFVARVRDMASIEQIFVVTKEHNKAPFERSTPTMYYSRIIANLKKDAEQVNADFYNEPQQANYLEHTAANGLMYDEQGKVVVDTLYAANRAEQLALNNSHLTDYFGDIEPFVLKRTKHTTAAAKAANEACKVVNEQYAEIEQQVSEATKEAESSELFGLASLVADATPSRELKNYLRANVGIMPNAKAESNADADAEQIRLEVATEVFNEFYVWHKLGLQWQDSHKLIFEPQPQKKPQIEPLNEQQEQQPQQEQAEQQEQQIYNGLHVFTDVHDCSQVFTDVHNCSQPQKSRLMPPQQRAEYKAIISSFLSRDAKGNKIRAFEQRGNEQAKTALLEAFNKASNTQLTAKEIHSTIRKFKRGMSEAQSLRLAKTMLNLKTKTDKSHTLTKYELLNEWSEATINEHFGITLPSQTSNQQAEPTTAEPYYFDDFGRLCEGVQF